MSINNSLLKTLDEADRLYNETEDFDDDFAEPIYNTPPSIEEDVDGDYVDDGPVAGQLSEEPQSVEHKIRSRMQYSQIRKTPQRILTGVPGSAELSQEDWTEAASQTIDVQADYSETPEASIISDSSALYSLNLADTDIPVTSPVGSRERTGSSVITNEPPPGDAEQLGRSEIDTAHAEEVEVEGQQESGVSQINEASEGILNNPTQEVSAVGDPGTAAIGYDYAGIGDGSVEQGSTDTGYVGQADRQTASVSEYQGSVEVTRRDVPLPSGGHGSSFAGIHTVAVDGRHSRQLGGIFSSTGDEEFPLPNVIQEELPQSPMTPPLEASVHTGEVDTGGSVELGSIGRPVEPTTQGYYQNPHFDTRPPEQNSEIEVSAGQTDGQGWSALGLPDNQRKSFQTSTDVASPGPILPRVDRQGHSSSVAPSSNVRGRGGGPRTAARRFDSPKDQTLSEILSEVNSDRGTPLESSSRHYQTQHGVDMPESVPTDYSKPIMEVVRVDEERLESLMTEHVIAVPPELITYPSSQSIGIDRANTNFERGDVSELSNEELIKQMMAKERQERHMQEHV